MPKLPKTLKEKYSKIFAAVNYLLTFAHGLKLPEHELLFTPGDRLIGDLGEYTERNRHELRAG